MLQNISYHKFYITTAKKVFPHAIYVDSKDSSFIIVSLLTLMMLVHSFNHSQVGALCACILGQKGHHVTVFEYRQGKWRLTTFILRLYANDEWLELTLSPGDFF